LLSDEEGERVVVQGKWYEGPMFVAGFKLSLLFIAFTAVVGGTFYFGLPALDLLYLFTHFNAWRSAKERGSLTSSLSALQFSTYHCFCSSLSLRSWEALSTLACLHLIRESQAESASNDMC
jgi:hypothetical protein